MATLCLLPSLLASTADRTSSLVSFGGILQAQTGLSALLASVAGLLAVAGSWRSIGPLFRAAAAVDPAGSS